MGFFDLANPLFDLLDSWLTVVSGATGRLVFWAILGSVVSMFLYRLTSRQEALAALKPQMKQAQKALATFAGTVCKTMKAANKKGYCKRYHSDEHLKAML